MNQQEFIRKLGKSVSRLPQAEREELISDYEDHFRNGLADGRTEEEIARSLGNPSQIGSSAEMESLLDGESGARGRSVARALFASTSLGIFNALFIVGPYAGLVGGMAGLWAGAIALALSGVGAIVLLIIGPLFPAISTGGLNPALVVFGSIGASALGLLASLGMWQLSKLFIRMTRRYVLFNVRIAKGEKK